MKLPVPGRPPPTHKVHTLASSGIAPADCAGFDDELSFNTQVSSQWDSLCHMQHQASGLSYNGASATAERLMQSSSSSSGVDAPDRLPTIDRWHVRGGLVGRGVLVDFKGWMEEALGKAYHPLDGHRITVAEVEAVARHQGVEFRPGDVLLVRTGMTEVLERDLTPEELAKLMEVRFAGLHGCEETARWVWNKRFSAVAGDSAAFEALPPLRPDGSEGGTADLGELFPICTSDTTPVNLGLAVLHQYFLAMFGLPIGELWDLKALAAHCKKTGRYSFMLTSAPLNHPNLVASPPNALAIF